MRMLLIHFNNLYSLSYEMEKYLPNRQLGHQRVFCSITLNDILHQKKNEMTTGLQRVAGKLL